jgi:hypothetical protein
MNEARESINARFALDGFDCQYTVRTDQEHELLLTTFRERLALLRAFGAVPNHPPPTTNNGSADPPPDINGQPVPTEPPTCVHCGDSSHMELLQFTRNGQQRAAYKCSACHSWHWPNAKKKAKAKKGDPCPSSQRNSGPANTAAPSTPASTSPTPPSAPAETAPPAERP